MNQNVESAVFGFSAADPSSCAADLVVAAERGQGRKSPVRLYYIPNGNDYHIADLLRQMFTEVKPFGCRDVQDYIDRRVLAYKTPNASALMMDEVRQMLPDLVYVESGKNIKPETLLRIRQELGIPVTMWFGDACVNEKFVERILEYAQAVDWQVVVDGHVASAAKRRGIDHVEFIPFFGYDHYFRPLNRPKTRDIFFSGRSYLGDPNYPFAEQRWAFVKQVNQRFGARLSVIGEGWEPIGLANYQNKRIPEWEVNEVNNESRIILAFDAAQVQDFTSCRTYHALLGKSFVVTRKFPGIEKLFVNGEHLVWFEEMEEGIALLQYYLDHPGECDRIAQRGLEYVNRNGWKFSNVVLHLVRRGLKQENRMFEQIHAAYSVPLPQNVEAGKDLIGRRRRDHPEVPNEPDHLLEQANSAFLREDLAQASELLERALSRSPNSVELLTTLGGIEFQRGDLEKARGRFLKATLQQPDCFPAFFQLAAVALRLDRIEEFEAALGRALELEPNHRDALKLLADLNYQQGRFVDAARTYRRILQQTPDDAEVLLPLGNCFFKTDDLETAKIVFERVLQIQPENALAGENLDVVMSKLSISENSRTTSSPDRKEPTTLQAMPHTTMSLPYEIRPLSFQEYFQPAAGLVEKWISVRPIRGSSGAGSSYQTLKEYSVRDFGAGLAAVEAILEHISKNKFQTAFQLKPDFWRRTVALVVTCELRSVVKKKFFDELNVRTLEDISPELAAAEPARVPDIERYAGMMRSGVDLGRALYISGGALNESMKVPRAEKKGIYMIDGARRITASALTHCRTIDILLLLTEDEYAALLPDAERKRLQTRLGALAWFNNYQAIPLVAIKGERTLNRFNLIDMALLRDQTIMDFGCNIGQACIQAVQAGAKQVTGIEGMSDTFSLAEQVRQLSGFGNLRYLNIDFNEPDFDKIIDQSHPEAVDYSFFFSVYRTKELKQRDRLFQYIIDKTRKGIFFEGHAHPVIDTVDYYNWLFDCFKLKPQFLGHSEGNLRPLFYLPLNKSEMVQLGVLERSLISSKERSTPIVETAPQVCLVSAIVSVYRCEKFIERKLQDLLEQSLGERLEIIVIDSNSPENEAPIIQKFIARHPNIKYLRTEQRESLYQAWNRGVRMASGKYITNSNADDRLRPDALALMAAELDRHPEVALVYGDFFITTLENMTVHDHVRCGYSIKPDYSADMMLAGCHIGPQPMWRKSVHEEIGFFDGRFVVAGDYEFWCRIATKYPMKHIPEFLGLYYHNPKGIVNQNKEAETREAAMIRELYEKKLPPPRPGLPTGYYFTESVAKDRFVNICMVTYNRLEYTRRAIAGLLKHTRYPHVITVVDNASRDGTSAYLQDLKAKGIIKNLILLDENVGIAKASNLAWSQEPSAEFYLKFDNDIVIQKPDWLEKMVGVLDAIPQIGVVGYNFEPVSYPLETKNGVSVRIKPKGNIGGACVMIPKRTQRRLGFWCEDYGLYSEEDADYGVRVAVDGLLNAYMPDEDIGIHLPSGKAAAIDGASLTASDHGETAEQPEYRRWKDDQRRKAVHGGKFRSNVSAYSTRARDLFVDSEFVKTYKSSPGPAKRNPGEKATGGGAQPQRTTEPLRAPLAEIGVVDPKADQKSPLPSPGYLPRRKLRIGFLSVEPDYFACPYLRLKSPLEYWSERGLVEYVTLYEFKEEKIRVIEENLAKVDVVVVQRQMARFLPIQALERLAGRHGFKLVYELDDAFSEIAPTHPGYQHYSSMGSEIEAYLRGANLVTVSTDWMKARYQKLNQRILVLPNAIDTRLWSGRTAPSTDGRVNILFSGTPTHDRDLEAIGAALFDTLIQYGDKLNLLCWGAIPKGLEGMRNVRTIETFRKDYREYARLLQNMRVDFGVVPLEDIPYNQAKSHIKWLEYSICGLPGIYSKVGEYTQSIRDGQTGVLVDNSYDQWLAGLARLIDDKPFRQAVAEQARLDVRNHHALEKKAHLWLEAYDGLFGGSDRFPMESAFRVEEKKTDQIPPGASGSIHSLVEQAGIDYQSGNFAAAQTALLTALETAPNDASILAALGGVLFARGEFAAAREQLLRAAELKRDEASIFVQLALACLKLDRIDEFETAVSRALELDPHHRESLKLLADLNFQNGRLKDAARFYVRIVTRYPDDAEALLPLGVCFFKDGDLETARTVFERVLEFHPENGVAQENLEAIRQKAELEKSKEREEPRREPVVPNLAQLVEQANFFSDVGNREAALECLEQAVEIAPRDSQVVAALGSSHFTMANYEAAREQFRRLIELRPRDPDAYTSLAMTCLKLNRIEEMESALGIALEIDPDHREALRFLAKTNLENNRVRDAGRAYARLLEKQPGDIETLLSLGLCFYRGGDHESARMVYLRVLEADSENLTARENLYQLDRLAQKGRTSTSPHSTAMNPSGNPESVIEMNRFLAQADAAFGTQNLAGARDALKAALAISPDSPEILSALGSLCFQLGDMAEARALLQRLVKRVTVDPGKWVQLALAHYQLGEIESFENALGRALELDPNHLDALRMLAHLNFNHGSIPDAARTYGKILKQTPDDLEIILALGVCFFKLRDYEAAQMMFERALELDPDNSLARENLQVVRAKTKASEAPDLKVVGDPSGEVSEAAVEAALLEGENCLTQGNLLGACTALEKAAQLSPNSPEVRATLGSLLFQLGHWERSRADLARAVELRPDSADYHTRLALVLLKLGRIPEFEASIGRALELDTNYIPALKLRADLSFQSGNIKEAAQFYHRILKQTPDALDVMTPLGVCFYKTGDLETARSVFERILKLDPENVLARENLAVLARSSVQPAQAGTISAGDILVSIVIPVFNQLHFTRQCLETIYRHRSENPSFEIIVVDNGSSDGTSEFLEREQRNQAFLRYERNEFNLGFARACNQGARLARGRFVLFLNNDTQPQPGWLKAMLVVLETDPTVAAVGAKLLYPDGRIQHGGIQIVEDNASGDRLLARNAFIGQPAEWPEANSARICQAVTAACVMIRKSSFEAVGGFDEEYWNGYEDVDLCFKLNEKGWLVVYQPQSVVIHHESRSGPERFKKAQQNIARLHQKWLGKIAPDRIVTSMGMVLPGPRGSSRDYAPPAVASTAAAAAPPRPFVSIIILTRNQLEHTRKCLESIWQQTPEPHELIIVDNGSTDGTVDFLKELQAGGRDVKVIFNPVNRGFAAGNNQGLVQAKGDFVLLLNNDTVVTPGWLRGMLSVFERDPNIGIAGPMSNYVSGPQLVSEKGYQSLDQLPEFARGWAVRHAGQIFEINRVVGFCLMARRAVVEKIGGLDEHFGSGNFEDDDFCIRARLAGYKAVVAKDVFIHHTGSQTFRGEKIDYLESMRRNWDLFKAKWNLPPEAKLEQGYRIAHAPFDPAKHFIGLSSPVEAPGLVQATGDVAVPEADGKEAAQPFEAPAVARIGSLQKVHGLSAKKKYLQAWNATLEAIRLRPFHPDAYLQMTDIALEAGDERQAQRCAERLLQMTPNWEMARKVAALFSTSKKLQRSKIKWSPLPPQLEKPRVSVCLIVKNEEEFIGQCLASIKPLASQIVVVDTGSTDRTVEIAKEYGAEVHFFQWNDNFSDARNAAHQHARGDWVLILDADEELPLESHANLMQDMAAQNVLGYRIPICNLAEAPDAVTYVPRLFRNAPALFFVGRVHEQIYASVLARKSDWGMEAKLGTAKIIHHGYDPTLVKRRQKVKRNLALMERAIAELPGEAALLMNYGLDLVNDGRLEEGLEKYRDAVRVMEPHPANTVLPEVRERLVTLFGVHLIRASRFDEVVQLMTSRLAADCGPTASMCFVAALGLMRLGRAAEAIPHLRECLKRRHIQALTPPCREIEKGGPHHLLGECLAKTGQNEEAEKQFKLALEQEPQAPGILHDYAHFLHLQNRSLEALQMLHGAVASGVNDEKIWHLGSFIANGKAEFVEFGLDWTAEALKYFPEHAGIKGFRGESLLKAGRLEEALPFFLETAKGDQPAATAGVILCQLALNQNPAKVSLDQEPRVSREFVAWYRRLLATNAKTSILAINGKFGELRKVLPTAAAILEQVLAESEPPR
jgi:GT2 family glycosyltransferase/Flp pilus assembly protein TadD/glycosyltransferase involved in cell wall biosynthesis